MAAATDTIRYHVTGMDCASCAAKIEGAARKVEGVDEVKVDSVPRRGVGAPTFGEVRA